MISSAPLVTYDPWGNTTTAAGTLATTNPWHYAGSYTDAATGNLKLGARYYNPTTARFTQPDPAAPDLAHDLGLAIIAGL